MEDEDTKRPRLLLHPPPPPPIQQRRQHSWSISEVKVNEWQLYSPKLAELLELEKEEISLTQTQVEEKNQLFTEGYPSWDRKDFKHFYLHVQNVSRYMNAFWNRGPECFSPENWTNILQRVQGQQQQLSSSSSSNAGTSCNSMNEQEKVIHTEFLINEVLKKISTGKVEFSKSLQTLQGHHFCAEEDYFLLKCYTEKMSKEEMKEESLKYPKFYFDHFFRSLTCFELENRLGLLLNLIQKDCEENQKNQLKIQKEAEKLLVEENNLLKREAEIVARIEEIEKGLNHHKNGSSIKEIVSIPISPPTIISITSTTTTEQNSSEVETMDDDTFDKDSDNGLTIGTLDVKYQEAVMKMVIASGTCGMAQLVDKVTRMLPEGVISKRQLKRDILRLAVKEKRSGDRAARWYARDIPLNE